MSLALKDVEHFIADQVERGVCSSEQEAEHELAQLLVKREIERGLARGREDIRQGRYEEVTPETNAKLIAELAAELLPRNS